MKNLALLANPLVRRILPLLGDIADEFGSTTPSEHAVSEVVSAIRRVIPAISVLRRTSVLNASAGDISGVFSCLGLELRSQDVDLWLGEIQAFASSPDETLQAFFTGADFRRMMSSIITRRQGSSPQPSGRGVIPTYDLDTGTFIFP